MATAHVMEQSRAIPVDVDTAFRRTLAVSLPSIFSRRYGPIGPVKAVRDQTGDWATVGQTRTVVQAGGGSMREELTLVDAPKAFGYRLSGIKGPLAPVVDHIEGAWLFAPTGSGTNVTWRWTIHPKSAAAGLAMPAFAALWRGFARQGLEQLSGELLS
ncbi:MAG: SRPBCC family protein [Actinomycetia bacterium]|nr:SRPBCC family protein [Actinomycetes bacterium]